MHIPHPNDPDFSVQTAEAFWGAIDANVLSFLSLPDRQLKRQVKDVGGEDTSLAKKVALLVAEIITPYDVSSCCELITLIPAFFEDDVYGFNGGGGVAARQLFEKRVKDDIVEYVTEQWEMYLAATGQTMESRQRKRKRPLEEVVRPRTPPDPYDGWSEDRWLQAYADAPLENKAAIRYAAAQRGLESEKWSGVAGELRERYRTSNEYQGFVLRREAQILGISTELWNRRPADAPLPVDQEKEVREQLLQELRESEPLETLGAYCTLFVEYALRAKALGTVELWQAFRATAYSWIESHEKGAENMLRTYQINARLIWQHPDNTLNLQFLARYEIGECVQAILQKHFLSADHA
jgi:hypothetical protein